MMGKKEKVKERRAKRNLERMVRNKDLRMMIEKDMRSQSRKKRLWILNKKIKFHQSQNPQRKLIKARANWKLIQKAKKQKHSLQLQQPHKGLLKTYPTI